ncbi:hypothetical protein J132_02824 [Termitomyces sp. J132]|nr:hypothetical protein J132_02824 [Termitomyces sp. J132]
MSEPTLKRKRPPTFHHLPASKAKKLKQAWIENKKIKTKWKAEKRREGIHTQPDEGLEELDDGVHGLGSGTDDASEKEVVSEPEEKPEPKKSTLHPSRSHIHPELAPSQSKRPKVHEDDPSSQSLSLRELTRKAYSRESLHTFKAGQRTRGGANGRGGSRGSGRGASHGMTGRGQPNMKLRMGAMLEKIKQSME